MPLFENIRLIPFPRVNSVNRETLFVKRRNGERPSRASRFTLHAERM